MKKLILMGLIVSGLGNTQTGGNFTIQKSTIASGGGKSSGGNFMLTGTIGQVDANDVLEGGDFSLAGGFWNHSLVIPRDDLIFNNGFE